MSAYELAVSGLSSQAVTEAAQRFIAGVVEGQSMDFAPSPPRFVHEARRRQEFIDMKATPRLPAPTPYLPGPLAPFQIRRERKRMENAHLPVLFEDISYDEFRALSKARQIPVGAKWIAALATVFGPEPKQ